jgi:hypothetical protein
MTLEPFIWIFLILWSITGFILYLSQCGNGLLNNKQFLLLCVLSGPLVWTISLFFMLPLAGLITIFEKIKNRLN